MNQDTKDITLTWSESGPDALIQAARSIDMKLIGILAASSVLIGVSASLGGTGRVNPFQVDWPLIPFSLAAVAYVINFVGTLWKIWPRKFELCADPTNMETYWQYEPERAREARWRVLKRAYERNLAISESKGNWLKASTALLGTETIALVAWLIWATSLTAAASPLW